MVLVYKSLTGEKLFLWFIFILSFLRVSQSKPHVAPAVALPVSNDQVSTVPAMLAIEQNPETQMKSIEGYSNTATNAPQSYEERMRAIRASFTNPDPLLSDVTYFNTQNRLSNRY